MSVMAALGLERQRYFRCGCRLLQIPKTPKGLLGLRTSVWPLRLASSFLGLLAATSVALSSVYAQKTSPLHLEKEIPLPDVEGRIDHFCADVPGQRLFVAALENGTVEVLDIRKSERSAEIKGLTEPQGVAYSSQNSELYVASGGDGTLRIYDGNSLKLRETLEFGDDADNVRYDGRSAQILVGFGDGGLGLVDASGQKIGTIPLSSHPESFQLEEGDSRIFVNVPKEFAVAIADRTKHTVIAKWGLDRAFANYPMALDEEDKRLFVGCRLPARLVVLNTDSGQVVAKMPVVGDTDDRRSRLLLGRPIALFSAVGRRGSPRRCDTWAKRATGQSALSGFRGQPQAGRPAGGAERTHGRVSFRSTSSVVLPLGMTAARRPL